MTDDVSKEPCDQMTEWRPIHTAPNGVLVRTIICDQDGPRNDQPLRRSGRLWFAADGSMYVYYTPTHWMPLS